LQPFKKNNFDNFDKSESSAESEREVYHKGEKTQTTREMIE
jgi:hypothetical protein